MNPQLRALLFFGCLLVAPGLWMLGERLGGTPGAVGLTSAVVAGAALYAFRSGSSPKPPAGAMPS